MVRRNLTDIPIYPPPRGYVVRGFQAGDDVNWLAVQTRADSYNSFSLEMYCREFAEGADQLADRQLFLVSPAAEVTGTATAWLPERNVDGDFGRIHWVAVLPQMQGQGLGKVLLSSVCLQLKSLAYTRAYVTTEVWRRAAVQIYEQFGFEATVRSEVYGSSTGGSPTG